MTTENRRYNRQELLAALDPGWKQYILRLHELSEEEQLLYAQAQGFARVQDVLVHTLAWWERSMQRTFEILKGHIVPPANDMDEFNTEVNWALSVMDSRSRRERIRDHPGDI